jgi:hypothetical protein
MMPEPMGEVNFLVAEVANHSEPVGNGHWARSIIRTPPCFIVVRHNPGRSERRSVQAENDIHGPATANVDAWGAEMREGVRLVAAHVLQRIGKNGKGSCIQETAAQ